MFAAVAKHGNHARTGCSLPLCGMWRNATPNTWGETGSSCHEDREVLLGNWCFVITGLEILTKDFWKAGRLVVVLSDKNGVVL